MFIDLHCDTLFELLYRRKPGSLYENDIMVDFRRMRTGGQTAQFYAVFMPDEEMLRENPGYPADDDSIAMLSEQLKRECAEHADLIKMAYSYEDLAANMKSGLMSAFLTIEDGRAVQGNMERLYWLHETGVRLITLTWNHPNCFGFPNAIPEYMDKGLTEFGVEALSEMNRLGMIIDVSHLSDGGFRDVIKYSKRPIVASHSNCRALSPHVRNLTDGMIRALAENGGVSGINFFSRFLNPDIESADSTIELIVAHMKHMKNVGGIEVVALGSDFDGVVCNLEVSSSDGVSLIFDRMAKEGFKTGEIEKVAYVNAMRVIKDTL